MAPCSSRIKNKGTANEVHQIVLIKGGPAEVSVKPGNGQTCNDDDEVAGETALLIDPWTFVEASRTGNNASYCYTLSDPDRVNRKANMELWRFVRAALAARRAQALVQQ